MRRMHTSASKERMLGILRMLGRLTSGELGFAFAPRNESLAFPGRGSRLKKRELSSWEEEIGHTTILYTDKGGLILKKDELGDWASKKRMLAYSAQNT